MKWPGVCKNRRPPLKNVNGCFVRIEQKFIDAYFIIEC